MVPIPLKTEEALELASEEDDESDETVSPVAARASMVHVRARTKKSAGTETRSIVRLREIIVEGGKVP